MQNKDVLKLNKINDEYKTLKKITPFVIYKSHKIFFLFGVFIMPFISLFIIIFNKIIKDDIFLYISQLNETLFVILSSFLLLYLVLSTFFITLITYSSYYFTLNNFKKNKLSKFELELCDEIISFKHLEKKIIDLKKEAKYIALKIS